MERPSSLSSNQRHCGRRTATEPSLTPQGLSCCLLVGQCFQGQFAVLLHLSLCRQVIYLARLAMPLEFDYGVSLRLGGGMPPSFIVYKLVCQLHAELGYSWQGIPKV